MQILDPRNDIDSLVVPAHSCNVVHTTLNNYTDKKMLDATLTVYTTDSEIIFFFEGVIHFIRSC